MPACLEPTGSDGVRLRVKVQPRAARTELAGVLGDALKVRVAAPPVDDAANEELRRFLAETLDVPRSAVTLVRGRASGHKVLVVSGLTAAEAARRLGLGD